MSVTENKMAAIPSQVSAVKYYNTITSLLFNKHPAIWFHHNQYTMVIYEENTDEETEVDDAPTPPSYHMPYAIKQIF